LDSCARIRDLLLEGGILELEDLTPAQQHFSVNGLIADSAERHALIDAMEEPFHPNPQVEQSYARFASTRHWAAKALSESELTPAELIAQNYRSVISSSYASSTDVQLAWAEYELRRRVHFGCELILSDLTATLMDLAAGTVDAVIESWLKSETLPDATRERSGLARLADDITLGEWLERLPEKPFLETPLNGRQGRQVDHQGGRAAYGLALILSCYLQTTALRSEKAFPDRHHTLERAFRLVDSQRSAGLSKVLREFTLQLAISPHLEATLRKMGQGQKCSLRFFPEGDILQPTGMPAGAGFSGSRLGNVLGIISDVGLCQRLPKGRYALTDEGRSQLLEGAD